MEARLTEALAQLRSQRASGRDESETCCICTDAVLSPARLEPCSHSFCTSCIAKWTSKCSKCPLCKREAAAYVRRVDGVQVPIAEREFQVSPGTPGALDNDDDSVVWDDDEEEEADDDGRHSCQVCGLDFAPDRILLCDGCDRGFHLHCLCPPLAEVPEGDWLCTSCSEAADVSTLSLPFTNTSARDGAGSTGLQASQATTWLAGEAERNVRRGVEDSPLFVPQHKRRRVLDDDDDD